MGRSAVVAAAVACLALAAVPSVSPGATVGPVAAAAQDSDLLWTGDVETGDLSQFVVGTWNRVGGKPPRLVTRPVREGRYAVALELDGATTSSDGICCGSRNELLPRVPDLEEGDEAYFGFSTCLGTGFPTSGGWQLITQFKQNFDGAPPLGLYVEDGKYKIEGGYGHPDGPRPFMRVLAPAPTDQWVDWVLHVRFSAQSGRGFVEVWKDGELVLPRFTPASGTLYPGPNGGRAGSYVKTGPYRDPNLTQPGVLYLDAWRIGRTRAAVSP